MTAYESLLALQIVGGALVVGGFLGYGLYRWVYAEKKIRP